MPVGDPRQLGHRGLHVERRRVAAGAHVADRRRRRSSSASACSFSPSRAFDPLVQLRCQLELLLQSRQLAVPSLRQRFARARFCADALADVRSSIASQRLERQVIGAQVVDADEEHRSAMPRNACERELLRRQLAPSSTVLEMCRSFRRSGRAAASPPSSSTLADPLEVLRASRCASRAAICGARPRDSRRRCGRGAGNSSRRARPRPPPPRRPPDDHQRRAGDHSRADAAEHAERGRVDERRMLQALAERRRALIAARREIGSAAAIRSLKSTSRRRDTSRAAGDTGRRARIRPAAAAAAATSPCR